MTALASKLRTALALGPTSIVSVLAYRAQLKLGIHPVQWIRAKNPIGPFFGPPTDMDAALPAVPAWREEGECFGWFRYKLDGEPPHWHRNPLTGQVVLEAERPWWKIPDFDPTIGDIKGIWEASRFGWVVAMAQQARRGEPDTIDRLNAWLSDWVEANPPYRGPNWKCGQECSLRVLHLSVAAMVLDQSELPPPGLLDFVALSLRRVAPTRAYAIAQNNNHGTSEAAALFVGGSWLAAAGHPEGAQWQRQGRDMLEERVGRLIAKDGTFSQYSIAYHRLMLDTLSLAEIWRRRMGLEPFSQRLRSRAAQATHWMLAFVDPDTGDVANIGANDGAHILDLAQAGYRDFRPSAGLAASLFLDRQAFGAMAEATLCWLGLKAADAPITPSGSHIFDDGGFAVLRRGKATAVLRYPRFRFRPSQADALHLDLSVDGLNHLRDAGSYSYNADDDWVRYFSGTGAHNTIMVDDRDQMPRLSRFLFGDWLETAEVIPLSEAEDDVSFGARYADRHGATHERLVSLSTGRLHVTDTVSGFRSKAVLRWRLAPGDWSLQGQEASNGSARMHISADVPLVRLEIREGWESRYYHARLQLPVLEAEIAEPGAMTSIYEWRL